MGTPYVEVYDTFLSGIKDPLYAIMDEDEREIEFLTLLDKSIPRFLYPKVDLDDRSSSTSTFNENLTFQEIQILAELMKREWVNQKINDVALIEQQYSDHDFKLTSQAAHLRVLLTLKANIESDVKDMQHAYSKVKDRKPDFSGLAGR